jgi:hypothetical protein
MNKLSYKRTVMKKTTRSIISSLLVLTIVNGLYGQHALQIPAIEGAKQALARLVAAKSIDNVPDALTNRSCAGLAIGLIVGAELMIALGDAMTSGQTKGGKKTAKPDPKMKAMKLALDGILKRYGLSDRFLAKENRRKWNTAEVEKQGRPMLRELIALMNKLGDDNSKSDKTPTIPAESELTFEEISPTVVRITPKNDQPFVDFANKKSIEARLEDGAWRIDVGGIGDVLKSLDEGFKSQPKP